MTAETNSQKLLITMEPVLSPQEYVFSSVTDANFRNLQVELWGWFREPEGVTLILEKRAAIAAGLDHLYTSRKITLNVHSSLEAIGFLAIITKHLAEADISVNAISAYYHDHLFVPADQSDQAMVILKQLMEDAGNGLHPRIS